MNDVHLMIVTIGGLALAVVVLLVILGGLIWAYARLARAFIDLEKRHRECRHALSRRESSRSGK